MTDTPIVMTREFWLNSQLSIARYSGGIKLNGKQYVVEGTDLILIDWLPVYKTLGRERTIGLIKNGTTLDVAKQMCEQVKAMRENNLLKLF